METLPDDFEWLSPWHPIAPGDEWPRKWMGEFNLETPEDETVARSLEDELRREIPEDHPLAGLEVRAVGYCYADPNEFLYVTNSPEHPIACVHLTWKKETDRMFPYTNLYANSSEWARQMLREHEGAKAQRAEHRTSGKRLWRRWLGRLWKR